jgi:hypothetical protein
MAAGDAFQWVAKGQCLGQDVYNVYCAIEGASSPTSLDDWIFGFLELLMVGVTSPGINGLLPVAYTVSEAAWRPLPLVPGGGEIAFSFSSLGGVADGAEIMQASAVAKLLTPQGGRRGRGRKYFGPLASAILDNGQLTANAFAAFTDSMNEMLAAYGQGGGADDSYTWGIWSDVNQAAYPITGIVPNQIVYTQRRRVIGVGG